jgi:hypothetical protein
MGLLRLVFIFIGISVCSELPTDDGVSFFRSFFAFFIMLAFDYSRMAFKGKSPFEIWLGRIGLFYTLMQSAICWLGTGRQFVIHKTDASYNIISSETFRLFPYMNIQIDSYMQWTLYLTLFVAGFELVVPNINRYSQKRTEEATPKTKTRLFFWRRSAPVNSNEINLDQNVSETISGGGK